MTRSYWYLLGAGRRQRAAARGAPGPPRTPERRGCSQHLLRGRWAGVSRGGGRRGSAGLPRGEAPRGAGWLSLRSGRCPAPGLRAGRPWPFCAGFKQRAPGASGRVCRGSLPPGAGGLGQSSVPRDPAPGVGSGAMAAALPCPSFPQPSFLPGGGGATEGSG